VPTRGVRDISSMPPSQWTSVAVIRDNLIPYTPSVSGCAFRESMICVAASKMTKWIIYLTKAKYIEGSGFWTASLISRDVGEPNDDDQVVRKWSDSYIIWWKSMGFKLVETFSPILSWSTNEVCENDPNSFIAFTKAKGFQDHFGTSFDVPEQFQDGIDAMKAICFVCFGTLSQASQPLKAT
jgi:hypothetical protein